jgi:FkbM family methyltransferase
MGALTEARQVLTFVWQHPANRDQRLRAVGRAVSFQLRGRLGRPTLTTIGTGARMWAELHTAATSKVVYANPPDWAEMQVWRRVLKPGAVFVDVGSNVGAYALWAAECGARVIAVEPDPTAVQRLRRNIALNRFPISVLACALSDTPGVVRLTRGQDTTNHLILDVDGTGAPSPVTTAGADVAGAPVPAMTLDDVVGEGVVDGVKIDVEGAERLVLDGGHRALAQQRIKLLQLEWNGQSRTTLGEDRAPLARLLERFGYQTMRPDGTGTLLPTDPTGYGDDLFAVADSALPEVTGR